eukprot:scaffold6665_cov78-Skeletonema_dohrnii-CCMP3373.AAC.7
MGALSTMKRMCDRESASGRVISDAESLGRSYSLPMTQSPQEIADNQKGGSDMKTESEQSTVSHVFCASFNMK